ncbi:MAG: DUF480 domain-containing protein [Acidimicrobiales bacterium]|jgi:uncharacterized protein YceH (UPF0502 family)
MDLGSAELRVLAALVEKQLTTPQQYPLTGNAVVAACNQASNRAPVVAYDERTVESALAGLKDKSLVRFVHPSHGRSATRYRHVLDEVLGLSTRQLALVAVLALRGPQTVGELRARTERMADFAGVDDVERELEALAAGGAAVVTRRAREPGRKDIRYAQALASEEAAAARAPAPERVSGLGAAPPPSLADEVASLRDEVASLRRTVDEVLARLDGGGTGA